jgi:hypothetical protein
MPTLKSFTLITKMIGMMPVLTISEKTVVERRYIFLTYSFTVIYESRVRLRLLLFFAQKKTFFSFVFAHFFIPIFFPAFLLALHVSTHLFHFPFPLLF